MRRGRAGRGDKRKFTRSAMKTHVKNLNTNPMRGGIRL